MSEKPNIRKIWTYLTIQSINANAISLLTQLKEYDFLTVNDEQASKLNDLEEQFYQLVKEITNKKG